jgi:hypothetical protein
MGSSTSRSGGSASSAGRELTEREKRILHRKQKKISLMFIRVLMEYLEGKDKALHHKATRVLVDCAERKKRGERAYESATMAILGRLKDLVGDTYWKEAQEAAMQQAEGVCGGGAATTTQTPGGSMVAGQS